MIPLVDVSALKMLKDMFPTIPIVWAPMDNAKKALATHSSEDTIEFTGIAIYRMSVEVDTARTNQPMGYNGNIHKFSADKKSVALQRRAYVVATYELNAWSYRLSHINDISRRLAFSAFYEPIEVQVENLLYSFSTEVGDPNLTTNVEDRSDKIKEYNMSLSLRVHTFWVEYMDYSTIHTQFYDFYDELTGGLPVRYDRLEIIPGNQIS